jgi:heme/copper-type cytochrome/quinol oxidase subunit 2
MGRYGLSLVKREEIFMSRIITEVWTNDEIRAVAKWQKSINWMIFINIFVLLPLFYYFSIYFSEAVKAGQTVPPLVQTVSLGLTIILCIYLILQVIVTFRLAKAVRSSAPYLYPLFIFLGLLNIISLAYQSHKSTKILRACGIRVGLLRARSEDLEKLELVPDVVSVD